MIVEKMRQAPVPLPFSSRDSARGMVHGIYSEKVSIGKEGLGELQEINELIHRPEIDLLIEEGHLTLGIIKPNVNEGIGLPSSDEEASEIILGEIGSEHVIFQFSTSLTQEQIEAFYADVKVKYHDKNMPGHSQTIWEEVVEMLESGPITFLLLYEDEGNAVDWWRNRMGNTHPAEAPPDTIRGKFAIEENLPNNLTHGSDSVESVKREIGVLRGIVAEITARCEHLSTRFPSEHALSELGVVGEEDEMLLIQRFYDSGRRSESWIYGYQLFVRSYNGDIVTTRVREKNLISMGGNLEYRAQDQVRRYETLEGLGIPVPTIYGARGGAVYMEFIENDGTADALDSLAEPLSSESRPILDQLIDIAVRLDGAGYTVLDFIDDLIYDEERDMFLYSDVGSDFGTPGKTSTNSNIKRLLSSFPKHREYILEYVEGFVVE